MEDMSLFDQFHAAFEEAPPRGAFERLQRDLIRHSAARRRRRPAFGMSWTRMSTRLIAAVAAVVIVIALVAAYIAAQRSTVGGVPAGGGSVAAYQSMVRADSEIFSSLPRRCQTVTDAHCAADVASNRSALQAWLGDMDAFRTPAPFAVVDAQMRRHIRNLLDKLTAADSAVRNGDADLLREAIAFTNNDITWLRNALTGITASQPVTASQYVELLRAERANLGGDCSVCGDLEALTGNPCASPQDDLCRNNVAAAIDQISLVQADLAQFIAPESMAYQSSTLQRDLAQADDALMQMDLALFHGDAAGLRSGRAAFSDAMIAVMSDLQS